KDLPMPVETVESILGEEESTAIGNIEKDLLNSILVSDLDTKTINDQIKKLNETAKKLQRPDLSLPYAKINIEKINNEVQGFREALQILEQEHKSLWDSVGDFFSDKGRTQNVEEIRAQENADKIFKNLRRLQHYYAMGDLSPTTLSF
ncbi:MAG TPA: hypothetical protein DCM40_45290, partial [Maribacter sp.]|nr:hypothetical protein [Maribacter sp.]